MHVYNNVIVVCKKYYLDVVLKELESTNTYQEVHSDCSSVVSMHLKYVYIYMVYTKWHLCTGTTRTFAIILLVTKVA